MSTSRASAPLLRNHPSFYRWLMPALGVAVAATLAACASSSGPAGAASPGVSSAAAPAAAEAPPEPYYPKDTPTLPPRCGPFTDGMPNDAGRCNIFTAGSGRPTVVLWGDSHAFQWEPALEQLAKSKNVNLVAYFSGSCPPMLSPVANPSAGCNRSNWLATNYVKSLDRQHKEFRVVLGGSWQRYRAWIKGLSTYKYPCISNTYARKMAAQFKTSGPALFKTLGANGIRTDVIGQAPVVPISASYEPAAGKACATPTAASYRRSRALLQEDGTRQWLSGLMRPLRRPRLIDVAGELCTATSCAGYACGVYTFFNWLHVSKSRATLTQAPFRPTVNSLL